MDFIKKNAVLSGMIAGFVVLLGLGAFMLNSKVAERETVAAELQTKKDEYEQLMSRKPTPDLKNVESAKKYKELLAAGLQEPLSRLKQSFLSFDPIKENECKQRIIDTRDRIDKMLENNEVLVASRTAGSTAVFHYGFDRYATAIPKMEDTPMLQKQLKIVEELMKYAGEAKVTQILQVNRVEFEKDAAPAGSRPTRATPARPVGAAAKQRSPSTEPLISMGDEFLYVSNPGYLYSTMPFEIEIKCTSEALRDFLNKLAQSPFVFLPRIVTIENESKGNVIAHAASGPGSRGGGLEQKNSGDGSLLPDQHEKVFGYELLKVAMRVEWLEFGPEEVSNKSDQKKK
jgi:hypothetical protein